MMRYLVGLLTIVFVGVLAWGAHLSPAEAESLMVVLPDGCAALNDPGFDSRPPYGGYVHGEIGISQFYAGDSLILTAAEPAPGESAGTWLGVGGSIVDTDRTLPYELEYTFSADAEVGVEWYGNGWILFWNVTCNPSPTRPSAPVDPAANGSGPDMVPLPDTAVGGRFVSTTALYWAPNLGAETDEVMEVGQTLWVLGVDATGQFYQVVLSGQYLWVPVWTMAPNYDDVWHGTLLPTTVVD